MPLIPTYSNHILRKSVIFAWEISRPGCGLIGSAVKVDPKNGSRFRRAPFWSFLGGPKKQILYEIHGNVMEIP